MAFLERYREEISQHDYSYTTVYSPNDWMCAQKNAADYCEVRYALIEAAYDWRRRVLQEALYETVFG